MKSRTPDFPAPLDAEKRKAIPPVICYPVDQLQVAPLELYFRARKNFELVESLEVPPREAQTFEIPAGHFFRIVCVDGPQMGDLNLWQAENLQERFYSSKTRAAARYTSLDRRSTLIEVLLLASTDNDYG